MKHPNCKRNLFQRGDNTAPCIWHFRTKNNAFQCLESSQLIKLIKPKIHHVASRDTVEEITICRRSNFLTYSSFDELVYLFLLSNEVMLDEELDETELPTGTALELFCDVFL